MDNKGIIDGLRKGEKSVSSQEQEMQTGGSGVTAFLCLLERVIGPIKVHVDNKGIIDGLRKGERECIMPRAGDADLWINLVGITWSG